MVDLPGVWNGVLGTGGVTGLHRIGVERPTGAARGHDLLPVLLDSHSNQIAVVVPRAGPLAEGGRHGPSPARPARGTLESVWT